MAEQPASTPERSTRPPSGDGDATSTASSAATPSTLFDGTAATFARGRPLDGADPPARLGPVESWPPTLRTAAQMVLASSLPTMLLWGRALVPLQNAAYLEMARTRSPGDAHGDAHGDAYGVAQSDAPILERVFAGETITRTQAPSAEVRTISYGPLRDERGAVAGVLVTMLPTDDPVALRRLQVEREQLVMALAVERARLAEAFELAPSFLVVVRGPDHVIELANAAFTAIFPGRALIGRPALEAMPERHEQIGPRLDRVLVTGESFAGREVPAHVSPTPGAPPQRRYFDVTYVPYVEADGARSGVIVHGSDVTAHVEARREVERVLSECERLTQGEREARAAAEASARSRDEVLAVVSHDLRTPLSVIAMAAQSLAHDPESSVGTERAARLLAMIQRSAETMGRQVRDLLDVASIEAGRLALDVHDAGPASLVAQTAELFAAAAEAQRVTIETRGDADLPPVRADAERVLQALGNLVTNALAFTPHGGRITLCAERAPEGVAFSVTDTGAGIAAVDLPHIFDRFWQQRRGGGGGGGRRGTGLGLAIVRGIVEAHGGSVQVDSVVGVGSAFRFTLPAAC